MATTNIPSNQDINKALESAESTLEETKKEQKGKLNRTGKQIIDQAEQLVFDARRLVNEKNKNDLIQQIIAEGSEAYKDITENREQWKKLQVALNEFDSDELKKKMDNMSQVAKLVAIELISSPRFRQTIYDFFSVLYSVLIDASHIKNIGRPLRDAIREAATVTERPAQEAAIDAGEKLKEAGGEALKIGLDIMDPGKKMIQITPDQKNELIDSMRDILREVAKRERTQRIITGLFEIVDIIVRPAAQLTEKAAGAASEIADDRHLKRMVTLTQKLFEAFTRSSLDPLINHLKVLYISMAGDDEVRSYMRDLRETLSMVLQKPETLGDQKTRETMGDLIDRGRNLMQQKQGLRENFVGIRDEVNKMVIAMEEDPVTLALQEDVKHLVEMVLLDDRGRISFKPEVLDQLKVIALSALVNRLKFPLPPLTFDDGETLRFTVTGLVLSIKDLIPSKIIAENHGIAILNMKDLEGKGPEVTQAAEAVRIKMEHINVHMPEADIWFHRRTFPEVKDSGKAKIEIGGDGMDLTFILKAAMGSDRLFVLDKVDCTIHSLGLKLEQTQHDTVYNAMITIFKGFVKRNIEDAIQESVANIFDQMTDQIEQQVMNLRSKVKELGPH